MCLKLINQVMSLLIIDIVFRYHKESLTMKNLKILISTLAITILTACNGYETYENTGWAESRQNETINETATMIIEIADDIVEEGLDLEPILHFETTKTNQVSLLYVTTNQVVATHEFADYEAVDKIWTLSDGYFAAFVGEENLWMRAQRLHIEAGNTSLLDDVEFDHRTQTEKNFRIIIFDEKLNILETLPYDEEEFIAIWGSVMKFTEGTIYIYGSNFDADCFENASCYFQRVNANALTVENLFEYNSRQPFVPQGFTTDNQLLVTVSSSGGGPGQGNNPSFSLQYGTVDITTGEKRLLERENFWQLEVIYNESFMVISGNNTAGGIGHGQRRAEIIIYDIKNQSSTIIQTDDHDDLTMKFSFDGKYLITLNADGVLKKYNMSGELVAETLLDTANTGDINLFQSQIFPINNDIYIIHLYFWGNSLVDESGQEKNDGTRQILLATFD